ncbi:MAG: zinc metallopeptidase [Alistipes sp.]|nr:zinc metallopeptidase [Alistipes sp.]
MITLLQSSDAASEWISGTFTSSEAFILIIVIAIAGFIVQRRLQSVFDKYSKVMSPGGMSGAEAAERMLRDHNIRNVKITHVGGYLTDHFDPRSMTVNLSDAVYSSRSVAAIAVACHECGHAIQHAQGYAPLELRSKLVPVVSFSSQIATWVVIGGLVIMGATQNELVCWIGIGLIAMSALFSIVTLPVEYNASDRALEWMEGQRIMTGAELDGARTALRWAARTYLVAALSAVATVLYYITIVMGNRRNN